MNVAAEARGRSHSAPGRVPPRLARLVRAGSSLGHQLVAHRDLPVRDYLASLIPSGESRDENRHRELAARGLAEFLDRHGGPSDVDAVCDHLLRVPVIQQADHSNLLLDPETFANNFLFHIGCRERGASLMVISQCDTVSCISRRTPVWGPVFLRTRGSLYKVFPHSKRQLKDSVFCALPTPTHLSFDRLEGGADAGADPFLRRWVGRAVADPSDSYRRVNDEIWAALSMTGKTRRIAVDESFAALVAANELSDPHGPVARLLFDPEVRDRFLAAKRHFVASRDNLVVNLPEPDFFWFRRGSRLLPVVVSGAGADAELVLATDGTRLPIRFERRPIIEALRDSALYCDRLLAYTVRCLLPGIAAVGGTSQQDYVQLYQQILLETHRLTPFLAEPEVAAVSNRNASRLGGAPLLELSAEQHELIQGLGPDTDLDALEESFARRPLGEAIGSLSCASYFDKLLTRREAMDP